MRSKMTRCDYTPLTAGENYTLTLNYVENGGSFSIAFNDLKTAPYMDQGNRNFVIVTYDAVLNENAEIGLDGNPNRVTWNSPTTPTGTAGRTQEDTVIVFTYELDGTKVDGEDADTELEGAEFVLFRTYPSRSNGKLVW